jgi:hypothetical protein
MAKKRGRKRKNNLYFGPEEEEAVIKFLESDDSIERNRIYNKWLRKPFDKMIESLIRRYKLYRVGYTFEELHGDALSFLITKADKFEKAQGKKAYSYYGTICKNYILGLLMKDKKVLRQNYSFEDSLSTIEQRRDMQYELEDTDYELMNFIADVSAEIKRELASTPTNPKKKITENEQKVGDALIAILDNWDVIFDNLEGGAKFNKNAVLESMRNYTGLTTKDIRVSMKRFKSLYFLVKEDKISNGYL